MKGLDRCWQVILEERENGGRERRSLATIKLIKTSFVLQAAYSSWHASGTARNNRVDGSLDGGMKKDSILFSGGNFSSGLLHKNASELFKNH